jgi:hypothetical protein
MPAPRESSRVLQGGAAPLALEEVAVEIDHELPRCGVVDPL